MKASDKFRQANKEAKATLWATALVVLFWIAAGFGLAQFNISFFHTPLWVWGGCVGTWIFAIIVSIYLANHVFKDTELEDDKHE